MDALRSLYRYCATGTTEGEGDFLEEAFVTSEAYSHVIEPPAKSPRLLVGKKGSGKTALLKMLESSSVSAGIPVLLLRPDDLKISYAAGSSDIAAQKRLAFEALVHAVAVKLGTGLDGLISSEEAKLFAEAVRAGERDPDLVQKILGYLAPIGKSVAKIDFEKFVPSHGGEPVPSLLSAIKSNLQRRKGKVFYVLMDDTDQFASPTEPSQLNRIWGFILATRKLAEVSKSLRIIITFRSEVWGRLNVEQAGQRDQLDHVRPLVYMLNPSDDDIMRILKRRLNLAARAADEGPTMNIFDVFFAGPSVRLPSSNQTRSWADFLVKSSRERPRDVIQLVGMLSNAAISAKRSKIDSITTETVMVQYSKNLVHDIGVEFERDCPQLGAIIESFTGFDFEATAEQVQSHLLKLPTSFGITLRGKTLQPDARDDMFRLWGFLYEVGFLNPRIPDLREERQFRHVMFREEPGLVTKARWSEMQKATWEIHPAYRSHLIKRGQDEQARVGATRRTRDYDRRK